MLKLKRVAWIALLLIVVGLAGALFTYESYAESEEIREEKTFHEKVKDVVIETDNSKIEILPTTDDSIKVEFTGDTSKMYRYRFDAEVNNGTLHVKAKEKLLQIFNFDFTLRSMVTTVYLPDNVYQEITATTENGGLTINDIQVERLSGQSTNGGIHVDQVQAHTAYLESVNGKISIMDVDGDLNTKVTNGLIHIREENLDGNLNAETVNGKIHIQLEEEPTNAEINVEVENGHVNIFGNKSHHSIYGHGENQVNLKTVNGNIEVGY